jgi:hypothetical protein
LDNAPSLEPYQYKAWDGDARDFVNGILRQYLNPGDSLNSVVSKPAAKAVPKKTAPKAAPSNVAVSASEPTASVDNSDDLDSFLNDLDI